jgi:hypothetical protein
VDEGGRDLRHKIGWQAHVRPRAEGACREAARAERRGRTRRGAEKRWTKFFVSTSYVLEVEIEKMEK